MAGKKITTKKKKPAKKKKKATNALRATHPSTEESGCEVGTTWQHVCDLCQFTVETKKLDPPRYWGHASLHSSQESYQVVGDGWRVHRKGQDLNIGVLLCPGCTAWVADVLDGRATRPFLRTVACSRCGETLLAHPTPGMGFCPIHGKITISGRGAEDAT
jgi:hypothetical protein